MEVDMGRKLLGALLIIHGLAHTLAGMRASEGSLRWSMMAAWGLAFIGFTVAGCLLLGLRGVHGSWRRYAGAGVAGSIALLVLGWPGPLSGAGLAVDATILTIVLATRRPGGVIGSVGLESPEMRVRDKLVVVALALVTILGAARPIEMRWGSWKHELRAPLPGDDPGLLPTYQIQHAVTVRATPDKIWPWLVQLGEDRGGFYSYATLERLAGLHIRNADRIHPEWQDLAVGDTIFATHAGWLGQRRRFGWRVTMLRPDTVLVLENWGAFVLVPTGPDSTRLIVRTRGGGRDGPASVALAPLGFLLFEPIHFLMERKMLLTVKARAEGAVTVERAKGFETSLDPDAKAEPHQPEET
jgi:hypothetical protein